MSQRQTELAEAIGTSLASTTIEWGANLQVCEILEADPSLAPAAMRGIKAVLKKRDPVPVLLGLSLLEMIIKNCGMASCRAIDTGLAKSLREIIKHRESWQYGLGRTLHKYGAGWLPSSTGVDDSERRHWWKAQQKVLEILQLAADAFMLHEGELGPLFGVYKQLRKEGYDFPGRATGGAEACVASGLALVRGSQESPAYLGSAMEGSSEGAAAAAEPTSPPGVLLAAEEVDELRAAMRQLSDSGSGCTPEERGELSAKLRTARPRLLECIEEQAVKETEALDEVILQGLLTLLEELDNSLASEGDDEGSSTEQPPGAANGCAEHGEGVDLQSVELGDISIETAELEEMRRLLHELQGSSSCGADSADGDTLRKARSAHARLIAFISQRADHPAEELDEDFVANVVTLLDELDSVLERHDNPRHGQDTFLGVLPPRPVAQPPSVQEQETYDLMMARFLQAQELEGAQEADARLAQVLALDLEAGGRPWGHTSPIAGPLGRRPWVPREEPQELGLPGRAAPPARVIQVSGETPELLIGDEGIAEIPMRTASAGSSGGRQPKTEGHDSGRANTGGESLSEGLLGSSASLSRVKSWARWAPSSSSLSRQALFHRHGDDSQDYGQLEDAATPLVAGGSAPSTSAPSRGLLPWRRQSKKGEQHESLLSRVRVDDEWELVRPPAERPYWYNSATGTSQWEPPSFVMASSSP